MSIASNYYWGDRNLEQYLFLGVDEICDGVGVW